MHALHHRGSRRPWSLLLALPLAACTGTLSSGDKDPGGEQTPGKGPSDKGPGNGPSNTPPMAAPETRAEFEPLPPRVYAAKVKDLLTGLPLSNEELQAVTADNKALRGFIDQWMTLPQFREKMFAFWKVAFQQTQLDRIDLEEQLRINDLPGAEQTKLLRSVEEMFARTVMALVDEGRPFTETVTTTRFMMNVPLMVALSYMDAAPLDDLARNANAGFWIVQKYPKDAPLKYTQTANLDPATGLPVPIPLEETLDPTSPRFLTFSYTPKPLMEGQKPCNDPAVTMGTGVMRNVFRALFGSRPGCNYYTATTVFTEADWNTWRPVTVRAPRAGEERTIFWELPKLRDPKTAELVLATPRVGFMSTLAFFANWPTNPSNGYRVTVNQALIVALGRSFDDRGTTVVVNETSVDDQHVEPGSVCYACHQTLDPMRDFYKQSYSLTYFQQLDVKNPKNPIPEMGVFAVDGSPAVRGRGVDALAKAMAEHPRFAPAWVQKLCALANATPCTEDDPVFKDVAAAFAKDGFNWKTLVREFFSSPLVTFAAKTRTAEERGVVMSIARRDTFCDRLSNRLGIKDVCNQRGESGLPRIAGRARNLALGVPGVGYSRAEVEPLMPHDPNMFFASGTEKLCMEIAGQIIENGMTTKWKVTEKDQALADFVSVVMGVPPSDPRSGPLHDILKRHYSAAAATEKPMDALRSTFVVACASPLGVSSGL